MAVSDGWRVGKHARRLFELPPGAKPRYRFVIALGTIVLLAFGTMATVAAIFPESDPSAAADTEVTDPPTDPFDEFPSVGPDVTDPALAASSSPDAAPSGPRAGPLIGDYAVPPSAVWGTGFQAQLNMTNTTTSPQAWQVRLTYAQSVTGFIGSWVDGQPQPAIQLDGQTYTFTGVMPVPPGQTVSFKVQFDKVPQSNYNVRECSINGRPCNTQ